MRYILIASAAAALLSTSAMAHGTNYTQQQKQAPRDNAPVEDVGPPTSTVFPQDVLTPARGTTLTQQDRLFLMQGDRGIGNS